jgi:DNA-binding transcriptional LysR family regulator
MIDRPNRASIPPAQEAPIDFRRLQVFVSAGRHLSFAACAQELSLTPSAVSHAIRSLEEELASVLFNRHGPRVTLSRAGIRLMPIAEDLLARIQAIRGEITAMEVQTRQLRVGTPEFLCASLFPRVMPDFFECFPAFPFETEILESPAEKTQALDEGRVDLVLSIKDDMEGDVVRRSLFNTHFDFFVAPFHRLAESSRVTTEDLASQRLLIPHQSIKGLLNKAGLLAGMKSNRLWVLPSLESVREFARVGMGVAVLSGCGNGNPTETPGLQALSCSWPRIEATCSAFWLGKNQLSWAAEAFLSFVEMVDDF